MENIAKPKKNLLQKLLVEDWVVTFLSIPLLVLAGFAYYLPGKGPKVPDTLMTTVAWENIAELFLLALIVLYAGNKLLKRPMKGLLPSFMAVFAISLMAQMVATIPVVKKFGFEAVFFSVIFGLIIRNLFRVPKWMKPAIQGEFFIKIGVVCLGATILFRDFLTAGSMGLVQACIVVACVWLFGFFLSRRLGVDDSTAMTLSSGVSICGVSACITAAGVAKTDSKKLSYITSVVLIVVVPMIYLMPFLARLIVPLITDDVTIQNEIAGAWIGGTVDTTSGVGAASMGYNEDANKIAMIVKATQNVLIGVVAFCIATYLASKRGDGKLHRPSMGIVWDKFPKFVLGFIVASLVFSLLQQYGIFPDHAAKKLAETGLAKRFSGFFFSLAFVCIGLDTRLKDIVSKENRNVLHAFLGAQCFNIIVTFFLAWVCFGIVKPQISPKRAKKEAKEQVVSADATAQPAGENYTDVAQQTEAAKTDAAPAAKK